MSDYSKKLMTKAINDMDAFLSDLGLARKAVTKDETCLFRAVSEKLFFTQCHHNKVKDACLNYLLRHEDEYQPFVAEAIDERVNRVKEGKTRAGHLEMIVMSRMYRLDFVLFHTPSLNHYSLTDNFYNQVFLCYVNDNHYDLVYSKTFLQTAAICQGRPID
ncbi:putative bifunctional UDP-N-acetylglucosamine transferase and deubiquitinase ALG13 [Aplysia californica]|uniref:Bifunctional UDP-N-acetylglucosamine transferase and deubiquitinase ALG13 n=1 Tax=Aplysia californica TaxID=6500 RepID=A0ABM1VPC3_APLCA|nr:putative bifunctional UDP-N-acetylglucosamine transferase and deubiquitinase ALG13 [Aplysia californica]